MRANCSNKNGSGFTVPITWSIKHCLVLISSYCLCGALGIAQHSYTLGSLPAINLNLPTSGAWAWNAKTESRVLSQERFSDGSTQSGLDYQLTDLSLLSVRKTDLEGKLAIGYLIRLGNSLPLHRFIQQYTRISPYVGFRMGYRFAMDQSFRSGATPDYRFRFRMAAEIPLSGQVANAKEFYLKLSHEYLNSLQGGNQDLEIRLVPVLGFEFSDSNKLELGPDYRISSFLNGSPRSRFWLRANWFVVLP